jgi:hypothetical protein
MPAESITVHCDCGESHDLPGTDERFECSCGSIYVLTLTQLKPLLEE